MEDRLRKFVCVVDQDGFSKAASVLHLSQPALSAAINKLERELGGALLERSNKGIALTKAGEEAYLAAKDVSISIRNLRLKLTELSDQKPTISLGIIDSIAGNLFGSDKSFERLKQLSELSLTVNTSDQLLASTVRGDLDAALIIRSIRTEIPKVIEAKLIGQEPLTTVIKSSLRSKYEPLLARNVLADFLSYNVGSNSSRIIEDQLKKQGIKPKPVFHSTSPEVIFQMVLNGQGTAILPYEMVKTHLKTKKLADLSDFIPIIGRPIHLVKKRGCLLPIAYENAFASVSAMLERSFQEAAKKS